MSGYTSPVKLGPEETQALVVACSDRRYRAATEHFVEDQLGLACHDMVAAPGGPYVLVAGASQQVGMGMVEFLMGAHTPGTIVLVSHADCAGYIEGLKGQLASPGLSVEAVQRRDLKELRLRLGAAFEGVRVLAFYARPDEDERVVFEAV